MKVPRSLPRWVPTGVPNVFVPLEEVIGANLPALFSGMEVLRWFAFRITRYSDLDLGQIDQVDDLLDQVEQQVFRRRFGEVVRLEVQGGMPAALRRLLLQELNDVETQSVSALTEDDVHEGGRLLELGDLMALVGLELPELKDPPFTPIVPGVLREAGRSIFDVIRERDLLVHHPFHSFDATVERFIEEAAEDDHVIAIKLTLYRTSGDTEVVRALADAAQAGKQVAVLVELQARFDEVNNINWARTLERYGVHVAYGLRGAQDALQDRARRAARSGRRGAALRPHRDRELQLEDGAALHRHRAVHREPQRRSRPVRPVQFAHRLLAAAVVPQAARRAGEHALATDRAHRTRGGARRARGAAARIIAKMNALVDPETIAALYSASQAGVEIDLIVRGICCLRPQVAEVSERIRVTSIVGRFLEHSRVFYFANGEHSEYYIGSADWMPRNFDRRVEAMVPVEDPSLHAPLRSLLDTCLADNRQAWDLASDGRYAQRIPAPGEPARATHRTLQRDPWGQVHALPVEVPNDEALTRTSEHSARW